MSGLPGSDLIEQGLCTSGPPGLRRRVLDLGYYSGLLSAAEYHGAAHQRPQAFQVFLAKNRRPIQ